MNIRDVSEFLGFKKQKVYRLITSKKLIGKLNEKKTYEVEPKDFEAFMTHFNSFNNCSYQLTCLIDLSD